MTTVMGIFLLHALLLVFGRSDGAPGKYKEGSDMDTVTARLFLQENDIQSSKICNRMVKASWNYANNLTDDNKRNMLEMKQVMANFTKETWKNATSFAWKQMFKDDLQTYRWFKQLSILGNAALPDEKLQELDQLMADMEDIYSKSKVCDPKDTSSKPCNLALEPDLSGVLVKSRDNEELKYVWGAWRNVSGKCIKKKFMDYVALRNEAAKLNGFADAGELWREAYESNTFQEEVEELWRTLRPFYEQLHAFVRRRLLKQYPLEIQPEGPIPAHLLGNMWAQSWGNIFSLVEPYPNKSSVEVTDAMKEKKMTPLEMFKMSEEFFTSLGLKKMTPEFWSNSVIEKPTDREIVCHASAWDFCDGKDFRIKMCTEVNMEDLITVHHEMGHIQYYQQYTDQPNVFRTGANPGFHEAVGDVLALSVSTPDHLKKINLLKEVANDDEADINYLLHMALNKVAFLPFGYLIDLWRWNVFSGNITKEELNTKWWEMRLKYQGICPPVRRTEDDFDPAAKYHVASDVPYIRYFVSTIIQFQFHKALCDASGYIGPLHKCDIYRSTNAGDLLSMVLKKGSSVPWKEAMKIITEGKTDKMDAIGVIDYFDPLIKWLEKTNKGEFIGWKSSDPMLCP